jgi:hypothetical protein
MSIKEIFTIYHFHILLLFLSVICLILVLKKYFLVKSHSFYSHILFNIIIISFFHPLAFSLNWKIDGKELNHSFCDFQGFLIVFSQSGIDLWLINLMNTIYLMIIKSKILSFKKNKRLLFFYYFIGYIIPLIISCIFLINESYEMQKLNYCLIDIEKNNIFNYIFYCIHILPFLYCLFFFSQIFIFYKTMNKIEKHSKIFILSLKLSILPLFIFFGSLFFSITNFGNIESSIIIIIAGFTYSICCIFFSLIFLYNFLLYNCSKNSKNIFNSFDNSISINNTNEPEFYTDDY